MSFRVVEAGVGEILPHAASTRGPMSPNQVGDDRSGILQNAAMRYSLVEADVGEILTPAAFTRETDLALLLRDGRRPVAFDFVEAGSGGVGLDGVGRRVAVDTAVDLLAERLRQGLLARCGGEAAADPTQAPGVTVVVCTHDRPDDLKTCLRHIVAGAAEYPAAVEVLVVDNAPSDRRTEDVVRAVPQARYVREPVAGLDVARNRALAEATGPWIVFVDDDVRVDRWWLTGLASAIAEHPDASAVTGLVLPAQLDTEAQIRFERRGGFGRGFRQVRWDGLRLGGGRLQPLGAGVFGAGCNMAFALDAIRALGGFDTALDTGPPLPGGGDLDAFFKILDSGRVLVYEPQMLVFHRHRRTLTELTKQYHSWGTGFAAYLGARWKDRRLRPQIRRMCAWWMVYQLRQLRAAQDQVERTFVLAELVGGVVGSLDGYDRSRRRMAARFAASGRVPNEERAPA